MAICFIITSCSQKIEAVNSWNFNKVIDSVVIEEKTSVLRSLPGSIVFQDTETIMFPQAGAVISRLNLRTGKLTHVKDISEIFPYSETVSRLLNIDTTDINYLKSLHKIDLMNRPKVTVVGLQRISDTLCVFGIIYYPSQAPGQEKNKILVSLQPFFAFANLTCDSLWKITAPPNFKDTTSKVEATPYAGFLYSDTISYLGLSVGSLGDDAILRKYSSSYSAFLEDAEDFRSGPAPSVTGSGILSTAVFSNLLTPSTPLLMAHRGKVWDFNTHRLILNLEEIFHKYCSIQTIAYRNQNAIIAFSTYSNPKDVKYKLAKYNFTEKKIVEQQDVPKGRWIIGKSCIFRISKYQDFYYVYRY